MRSSYWYDLYMTLHRYTDYLQLYQDTSNFRSNIKKKAVAIVQPSYNLPLSTQEMPAELEDPTEEEAKTRQQLLIRLVSKKVTVLLDDDEANVGQFLKNGKNPISVRDYSRRYVDTHTLFTEEDQQPSASMPSSVH